MNKNLILLPGAGAAMLLLGLAFAGHGILAPLLDAAFLAVMFCSLYLFLACLSPRGIFSIWKDMPRLSLSLAALRCGLGICYSLILLAGNPADPAIGQYVIFQIGRVLTPQSLAASLALYVLLVIMNMFVIMKGLTRIAEVMARFSLDSLPGRQLSVDAELSSGVITPQQAEKKRAAISRSAAFYAAMDGCSKFLKGEFTCSVFMLALQAICLLAERSLGLLGSAPSSGSLLLQPLSAAIVLQMPAALAGGACCLSMFADGADAAQESRPSRHLASIIVVSGASVACALLMHFVGSPLASPALGVPPLLCLAAVRRLRAGGGPGPEPEAPRTAPEPPHTAMLTPVRVEIGSALVPLFIGPDAFLQERVHRLRTNVQRATGLDCPPIRIQDNPLLPSNAYRVHVNEVEQASATLNLEDVIAIRPSDDVPALATGSATLDPVFGLPAHWIPPAGTAQALTAGCHVLDCMSLLFLHLNELICAHMDELVSLEAAQQLLADLQQTSARELVKNYQAPSWTSTLQWVIRALAFERVPLRYPLLVLEALNSALSSNVTDNVALLDHVRQRLKRQICRDNADAQGTLNVVYISQALGDRLGAAAARGPAFLPEDIKELLDLLRRLVQERAGDLTFALVAPAAIRLPLHNVLRPLGLRLPVLSHQEIVPDVPVRVLALL